jgi:hypothetical protein
MSVADVCQVCEAAPARHTCDQCGSLVCDDHYERSHGLCVQCAARAGSQGVPDDSTDVLR